MTSGGLGKPYQAGETILKEGEPGDCMYVVQSGKVELIKGSGPHEICVEELGEGDFFGERELFEKQPRALTVRALSEVRVLSVDQKLLLRKIQEDPSLGFRIIHKLSRRVRDLETELMNATRARLDDAQVLLRRVSA